jgi:DNA-nicking Smr family endonuclease
MRDELAKKSRADAPSRRASAEQVAPRTSAQATPEDESLLLHRLYAGVVPLERPHERVPKQRVERVGVDPGATKRAASAAEADADAVHEHLRALVEGGVRFEVADDGRRVEGRRVDVPMDVLRRVRRGRLPIDARMDLHGMGVREARAQLELFLRTMRARGERCVLVIHGKGEHSPRGAGILRGEIAAWLSQGASSEHVAAFATAAEHDGGEGAVYVLLRR